MRRLWALVICCFVLCAVLRPALPVFVCAGMDGARMSRPCCPDDSDAAAAPPAKAWAARCCHAELPTMVDPSRPPAAPQRSGPAVWASLLIATLAPTPATPLVRSLPRRHGEPPAVGPPPPLHCPLRI